MNAFYDFNQRVHLRRDPSQYGLIGCGGYGDVYDARTGVQLVFWEHEGADIVTGELASDLMSEVEYHERRRLFFAVMRRPEMRLVRMALWCVRDAGWDWRLSAEVKVKRWGEYDDCWILCSDEWQCWTLWADDPNLGIYHFQVMCIGGNKANCHCEFCQDERRMAQESEVQG
jgi:hypothetical protein